MADKKTEPKAQDQDQELTDEQLKKVAGGGRGSNDSFSGDTTTGSGSTSGGTTTSGGRGTGGAF